MPLTPLANRPVDPTTCEVIRAVRRATAELGLHACLIGATARIILLEHVHGLHVGRATNDIDFAFAIENWDQFQAIKKQLTSTNLFEEVKDVAHRLKCKVDSSDHSVLVDLVPFGGIENSGSIAWPPEASILMNVAGFGDVCNAAVFVEIEPGLVIPIASIPGIVILKLFAWADRGAENPKDAMDLLVLLRQYHEAGNQDRIYADATPILEATGYDIEQAGAWLLGRDAHALASAETQRQLNELFNEPTRMEKLVTAMSKEIQARDDAIEYSRALLEQFINSFAHH